MSTSPVRRAPVASRPLSTERSASTDSPGLQSPSLQSPSLQSPSTKREVRAGDGLSTPAGTKSVVSSPDSRPIAPWEAGRAPRSGRNEDYGFGFSELTLNIHGHELNLRYGKANDVPEVRLDANAPLDAQLKSISDQMVALLEGPATALIDKNLAKHRIASPFDVEVKVDGKTVNLAKAEAGTLTPDFVNRALGEVLKQRVFSNVRADVAAFYGVQAPPGSVTNVTGAKAVAKLEAVLARAVELSDQGFGPPVPKDPVRREEYLNAVKNFALRNLFHGENLTTKHQVQGFDVITRNPDLNENLGHDIIDRASIQAVLQIDPNALEPLWARAWVLEEIAAQAPAAYQTLTGGGAPNEVAAKTDPKAIAELCKAHPEWTVNPNAGEARYLLPMYHWGDERNDADSMMHWHRAVAHHDGDLDAGTLSIQQKRQNGVEHHAGTEHEGVRHEVGMGYDAGLPFERAIRKIWADGAFKNPFWRTSAMKDIVFQRVLQERGIITPEDLQKSPNPARYERLDHAYQRLQGANVNADKALRTLSPLVAAEKTFTTALDTATPKTVEAAFARLESRAQSLGGEAGAALLQYAQAKLIQRSAASTDDTRAFMPLADRAREAAAKTGLKLAVTLTDLTAAEALEHRTELTQLKDAAQEARAGGDSSLAAVYELWNDILSAGFPSQAH